MKNRRNMIVAFLLCACLIVGVGYASLTDVLDIDGTAPINQSAAEEAFDQDVYFTAAVANDDGNTASVSATNNDQATFSAKNLKGKGDKATFTFTIKNEGDVEAVVTPSIANNTHEAYFDLYSDWAGQAKTLAAGETATYTLTVECIKTPTETISGSFLVRLTAVAGTTAE